MDGLQSKKLTALLLMFFCIFSILISSENSFANEKNLNGINLIAKDSFPPQSKEALDKLDYVKSLNAETVAVNFIAYQDKFNSTVIDFKKNADDMIFWVNQIHARGMRAYLRPLLDLHSDPDYWRGQINPGANLSVSESQKKWSEWFEQYSAYIEYLTEVALVSNAEGISIGVELTYPFQSKGELFLNLIRQIRARGYNGEISYSTNWGGDFDDLTKKAANLDPVYSKIWCELDYVATDLYNSISGPTESNPSYELLLKNANAWADGIEKNVLNANTKTKCNRMVGITEFGIKSQNYGTYKPYEWTGGNPVNLQLQAKAFQATFNAYLPRSWVKGVLLWNLYTNPNEGGVNDGSFSFYRKPLSETVIRDSFRK